MNKNIFHNKLVCPNCFGNLNFNYMEILCKKCMYEYEILEEIPILLTEDHSVFKKNFFVTNKKQIKDMYRDLSDYNHDDFKNRFSVFINYGYINEEATQNSRIKTEKLLINKKYIRLLVEVIGENNLDNKSILEIGCGRGGNLDTLSNYFNSTELNGLDLSYDNIKFCKTRYDKKNISFVVGDAEDIPFRDDSVDVVLNIESALHYPNVEKFYKNVYRILNAEGLFLYADIISKQEILQREKMLRDVGFSINRKQNITPHVLLSLSEELKNNLMDELKLKELNEFQHHQTYTKMKQGEMVYVIYNLLKTS